jgi:hypothetical protein
MMHKTNWVVDIAFDVVLKCYFFFVLLDMTPNR